MKLSKQEVDHIADLARLDLTKQEKEKYGEQLSQVLGYIDQLEKIDVESVEPTAQVTGSSNIFHEDIIEEWDDKERQEALEQAPNFEKGQYKVKKVL